MILRTCELLVLLLHNFTYSVLLVLHVVGRGGAIALLYPPPSPAPYSIVIDDSSWKNAAESFAVALTLTLGGTKVQ